MGRKVQLAGMETSIMAIDAVEFIDVSVPSSSFSNGANTSIASQATTSFTEDHASYTVLGDPPNYLIWYVPFLPLSLLIPLFGAIQPNCSSISSYAPGEFGRI